MRQLSISAYKFTLRPQARLAVYLYYEKLSNRIMFHAVYFTLFLLRYKIHIHFERILRTDVNRNLTKVTNVIIIIIILGHLQEYFKINIILQTLVAILVCPECSFTLQVWQAFTCYVTNRLVKHYTNRTAFHIEHRYLFK